jgi:hypothetical protein
VLARELADAPLESLDELVERPGRSGDPEIGHGGMNTPSNRDTVGPCSAPER